MGGLLFWVAVKELQLSYHNGHIYSNSYGFPNRVTELKFFNSDPVLGEETTVTRPVHSSWLTLLRRSQLGMGAWHRPRRGPAVSV